MRAPRAAHQGSRPSAASSSARAPHARPARTKVLVGLSAVFVSLAVVFVADFIITSDKIYSGVRVGDVDVSGLTVEEAAKAIDGRYSAAFAGNEVYVYADQETADRVASGEDVFSDVQVDEESTGSQTAWRVDAGSLQASFDPHAAAVEAFEVGRSDGGILARVSARFDGRDLPISATFNDSAIENLASAIDAVAGDPRVDCGIAVEDGHAYAVEGHDGMMVNRDDLVSALNAGLLDPDSTEATIIAEVEFAPMRIDMQSAQAAADKVNDAITYGVEFTYGDQVWSVSAAEFGSWVTAEPSMVDGQWVLELGIDVPAARSQLKQEVISAVGLADCVVSFESDSGEVLVHAQAQGQIPMLEQALEDLPGSLFGSSEGRTEAPVVAVPSVDVPETMTFDEAESLGVIVEISSFTTEYTADYPTRNHNIHLMSDYLDGSVAKAHSDWSMLQASGEISEAAGYQAASQIVDGELVDDFGGGVCQVATTVFNAVYESGFPIPVRHNHSLYMSSYPDGRDAAIAWSYLDLVWTNDSDSDVLVRAGYTDTTVTIELWGVDPGYSVATSTGEWAKGADYKVKVKYDPSLSDTEVNEEKKGKDGSSITVVRSVYGSDGMLVREDSFSSTYDPVNRIVSIKGDGDSKIMTQDEFQVLLEKREAQRKELDAESADSDSGDSKSESSASA